MDLSSRSEREGAARLAALLAEVRSCRLCRDDPRGAPLPHDPHPVLRASVTARIAVCGQAPGTRVHASGVPFSDPSGVRLRDWMGVTPDEFYDERRIAILPMGFCFPGLDAKGGDRPPRRECAPMWRARLIAALPRLELLLLIGRYAIDWHAPGLARDGLTGAVRQGLLPDRENSGRWLMALPHPSWRNNTWLKTHSWFASERLPNLKDEVRRRLDRGTNP